MVIRGLRKYDRQRLLPHSQTGEQRTLWLLFPYHMGFTVDAREGCQEAERGWVCNEAAACKPWHIFICICDYCMRHVPSLGRARLLVELLSMLIGITSPTISNLGGSCSVVVVRATWVRCVHLELLLGVVLRSCVCRELAKLSAGCLC